MNRTYTLEIHDLILIGSLREIPVATHIFLRQFSKQDNILRRRCTLLIQAAPSQNQNVSFYCVCGKSTTKWFKCTKKVKKKTKHMQYINEIYWHLVHFCGWVIYVFLSFFLSQLYIPKVILQEKGFLSIFFWDFK